MSAFQSQERLSGDIRPIIVNVMNFSKGPALLSFDDARTLFHEFGHALHGLLSNVTYPLLSGTSVSTDFVELPSQLFEHWLDRPEILRRFATHHRTGEPIPEPVLERLTAARNFNQGFSTVEYLACAFVDLDLHELTDPTGLDATAFESTALERIGMPREILMRHRIPHFTHVFSGGYAAVLQLSLVRGVGRRRVQGVRGERRRVPPGGRAQAQGEHLCRRQPARSRGSLRRVSRAPSDPRGAPRQTRPRASGGVIPPQRACDGDDARDRPSLLEEPSRFCRTVLKPDADEPTTAESGRWAAARSRRRP